MGSGNRLAIIAGSGMLPLHVANAARDAGENPFIVRLRDDPGSKSFSVARGFPPGDAQAQGIWQGFETAAIGVADAAGLGRLLHDKGIGRVVLSGAVSRRPDWRQIRPNLRILRKLPAIVGTLLSGGDDAVLRMVIGLIEAQGCRVIGAHEVAPDLLAATGPFGTLRPTDDDRRDIAMAARAALALGALDVGQGAVSVGGRIVALEGVEGTDEMLVRVAALRAQGRISARRKGALVKLCKPRQDMRADLPAIGVSTVDHAVAAGLAGIAVEAGRALVLDRDATLRRAEAAGIFVCGIDPGLEGGMP